MPEMPADSSVPAGQPVPAVTTQPSIGRGPGVTPPFAAPPREGRRRRLWIGLSIGAAVLILCCGGGGAGFAALLVTSTNQRRNEARTVVTSYMDDLRKQDYPAAYQLLCQDRKDDTTIGEFINHIDPNPLVGFTVGEPQVQAAAVEVPVRVNFSDGTYNDVFDVIVESGDSRICGQR